jgi:hypothetical protein
MRASADELSAWEALMDSLVVRWSRLSAYLVGSVLIAPS